MFVVVGSGRDLSSNQCLDTAGTRQPRGRPRGTKRVIVEAAWSYRFKAHKGPELTKRSEGVSAEVQAIAWKAQHRLHRKYRKLVSRGKNSQQVTRPHKRYQSLC